MKKQIVFVHGLLTLLVGLVFTSCDKLADPLNEVEYVPFQENKDGKWGMISNEGEVLFTEEFQNQPTLCVNGRFMVKNSDGLWEIYTAEKKPEKIGGEYLQAGMFYEDVAPVVEKGKPIQLIDRDGEAKVTLDKLNGKRVEECSNFCSGIAKVRVGEFWGAINTKGKIVVEPEYIELHIDIDGRMIGLHKRYKEADDAMKYVYTCLNRKGKEIGTVKGSKINSLRVVTTSYRHNNHFVNDGVVVSALKNDRDVEGIMGLDGEWLIKPSDKLVQFRQQRGDYFTFEGSDGLGVIDMKGEVHIRPKFFSLYFIDDKVIAGRKERNGSFMLYDVEGEKVSDEEYEDIFQFHKDEDYTIAKIGKADYVLLDRKGKENKIKTDIYNLGYGTSPDFYFVGDHVDIDDVVSGLEITKEGFFGVRQNMTISQAIEAINNHDMRYSIQTTASYWARSEKAYGTAKFGKADVEINLPVKGLINTFRTNTGWWSQTKYEWSGNPINSMSAIISSTTTEQLKGQMKTVYEKIVNVVKQQGKVDRSGKNAIIVKTSSNYCYYVFNTGQEVHLNFGSYDTSSLAVKEYDDATEEDAITPVSMSVTNEVDMDSVAIIDSTEIE